MNYEEQIYQVANNLNYNTRHRDKLYTFRIDQVLTLLETLGFNQWTVGKSGLSLEGVEQANNKAVRIEFNQTRYKRGKNLYMKLFNYKEEVIFVGVHDGIKKITDLRSMDTYYDEAIWNYRVYTGQVRLNAMANGTDPAKQIAQMDIAIKEMEALGIEGCKHLQMLSLTGGGDWEDDYAKMVPSLVGMYGNTQVLLKLQQYDGSMYITFFLFPKIGKREEEVNFGSIVVRDGKVISREVNMAAIIGGTHDA